MMPSATTLVTIIVIVVALIQLIFFTDMLWESCFKLIFKQLSHSMSVTNINCFKATAITIMVTKVVIEGSIFITVDIFYRHTMGKLFKIELLTTFL